MNGLSGDALRSDLHGNGQPVGGLCGNPLPVCFATTMAVEDTHRHRSQIAMRAVEYDATMASVLLGGALPDPYAVEAREASVLVEARRRCAAVCEACTIGGHAHALICPLRLADIFRAATIAWMRYPQGAGLALWEGALETSVSGFDALSDQLRVDALPFVVAAAFRTRIAEVLATQEPPWAHEALEAAYRAWNGERHPRVAALSYEVTLLRAALVHARERHPRAAWEAGSHHRDVGERLAGCAVVVDHAVSTGMLDELLAGGRALLASTEKTGEPR